MYLLIHRRIDAGGWEAHVSGPAIYHVGNTNSPDHKDEMFQKNFRIIHKRGLLPRLLSRDITYHHKHKSLKPPLNNNIQEQNFNPNNTDSTSEHRKHKHQLNFNMAQIHSQTCQSTKARASSEEIHPDGDTMVVSTAHSKFSSYFRY